MMNVYDLYQGLICMCKDKECRECYDSCPYKKRNGNKDNCNYMVGLDALQMIVDLTQEVAQFKQALDVSEKEKNGNAATT